MEFPLTQNTVYRPTPHFCERWEERNPDNWDRFLWILSINAHYLMCEDDSKRFHYLHYNPTDDKWFVVIVGRKSSDKTMPLITILPEDYYNRMTNATIIDRHRGDALRLLQQKNVLKSKHNRPVISFRLDGYGENRIVNIPMSWDILWPHPDLYPIHNDFDNVVAEITQSKEFITELERIYPVGYKSIGGWLKLFKKIVPMDISMETEYADLPKMQ